VNRKHFSLAKGLRAAVRLGVRSADVRPPHSGCGSVGPRFSRDDDRGRAPGLADAMKHPLKGLRVSLQGPRTEGPFARGVLQLVAIERRRPKIPHRSSSRLQPDYRLSTL